MNKNKKLILGFVIFTVFGTAAIVLSQHFLVFSQANAQAIPTSIYCGDAFSDPALSTACSPGFHTVIYCQNLSDNLCALPSGSIACASDCTTFQGTQLAKKYQYIGDSCKVSRFGTYDTLEACQASALQPPPSDRTELPQIGARTFCKSSKDKQNSCPNFDDFLYCENNGDSICETSRAAGGPGTNAIFCSNIDCSEVGKVGQFVKTRQYFSIVNGVCKVGTRGTYGTLERCQQKLSQPPQLPPPSPEPQPARQDKAECTLVKTGAKFSMTACPPAPEFTISCPAGWTIHLLGDGYQTCIKDGRTLSNIGTVTTIQTIIREVLPPQTTSQTESCEDYKKRLTSEQTANLTFLNLAENLIRQEKIQNKDIEKSAGMHLKETARDLRKLERAIKNFTCEKTTEIKETDQAVKQKIELLKTDLVLIQKETPQQKLYYGITEDLKVIDMMCNKVDKDKKSLCTKEELVLRGDLKAELDEFLGTPEVVLSSEITELGENVKKLKEQLLKRGKEEAKKFKKAPKSKKDGKKTKKKSKKTKKTKKKSK